MIPQASVVHSLLSLCAIWIAGRVNMYPDGPKGAAVPGNAISASQLAAAANAS